MEIRPLDRSIYAGKTFTVRYRTGGYWDISRDGHGFAVRRVPFDAPIERSFDDVFFGEWLEDPVAFGAFAGEEMLGFIEGSPESWNCRYRISNICVFDTAARRRGIGTALMEQILQTAVSSGARMAVLETQTCNENAIAFYQKCGFSPIGFDLYAYANDDPQRHEIRLEMGKKLDRPLPRR